MNQKQAKRLRRIEHDISLLHDAHYSTVTRFAQLEEWLYIPPPVRPSLWHRIRMWLRH